MNGFIGLTDYQWYLQQLGDQPSEVNFWRPLSGKMFRALQPTEPFFFKLKKAHGDWIAGFGLYAGFIPMKVGEAWRTFGRANGVESEAQMWERVEHYVRRNRGGGVERDHKIGCVMLTTPVFFPESHYVRQPRDWKSNIVTGSGYDLAYGEGERIWSECKARAMALRSEDDELVYNLALTSSSVEFRERITRVRLGQGAFRAMVTRAYEGTCVVSGDHTLPVLEAAHILGVTDGGPHELGNGLLLRADIHRLYDQHLVTVTPDFEFRVSERLREEFHNGAAYYALENRRLHLPSDPLQRPRREYLEAHHERFCTAS